jgi:hypothetical protein
MKRILLTLMNLFSFAPVLLAAEQPVELKLFDISSVLDDFIHMLGNFLADWYVLLLSVFALWFLLNCFKAFLDGRFERIKQEIERQERINKQVQRIEDNRAAERLIRQREIEKSGYVGEFEFEYNSRELQNSDKKEEIYRDDDGNNFRVIRHAGESGDYVEYVSVGSDYESKVLNDNRQDDSGYWLSGEQPQKSVDDSAYVIPYYDDDDSIPSVADYGSEVLNDNRQDGSGYWLPDEQSTDSIDDEDFIIPYEDDKLSSKRDDYSFDVSSHRFKRYFSEDDADGGGY